MSQKCVLLHSPRVPLPAQHVWEDRHAVRSSVHDGFAHFYEPRDPVPSGSPEDGLPPVPHPRLRRRLHEEGVVRLRKGLGLHLQADVTETRPGKGSGRGQGR
ncbi:uncharacterized protein LOC119573746 [Penaeus monodon]|uniref:uncharacterized protein LOC119573746 n=1 Tax=Penaeus monodon TaxID=6687 RepID=UPI0018A6F2A3|nr:uncharacterized protein LOC119573746 [Penaeus monodon]